MPRLIRDIFNTRVPKKDRYKEDLYRVKKVPYKKDDMRQINQLLKSRPAHTGSSGRSASVRRKSCGSYEHAGAQRVTFKMSYSMSMQAHDKYTSVYMPQTEKDTVAEKPVLFGTNESLYKKNKVAKHFKCIISPENQQIDLKVLTQEFIRRTEMLTGYKLYWQGCIHTDKEHRHVHVCINGKDCNGKSVYFQREMIERTMRETLSYTATQMIGERTPAEIEAARKNMINAKRWTPLDEKIENRAGKVGARNLSPEIQNRLAFLSTLHLAAKYEYFYVLKPEWKEVLVATGRYNTFFGEYQNSNGNLELYSGGSINGTVEKVITFDKDESWNDAVILNTGNKRVYVPVYQLKQENLTGKEISIENKNSRGKIKNSDIHVVAGKEKNPMAAKKTMQEN